MVVISLSSVYPPTEGIKCEQSDTRACFNDQDLGKGTLFITEREVSWVSTSGNGFSLEYPKIVLHAVSRDASSYPHDCLYLMLDSNFGDGNEEEETEEQVGGEIRFIPDDKNVLDSLFQAMSICQSLHPDNLMDSLSDEDFFEDADEEAPLTDTNSQMSNLHLSQNGNVPDDDVDGGCFEDADENPDN